MAADAAAPLMSLQVPASCRTSIRTVQSQADTFQSILHQSCTAQHPQNPQSESPKPSNSKTRNLKAFQNCCAN